MIATFWILFYSTRPRHSMFKSIKIWNIKQFYNLNRDDRYNLNRMTNVGIHVEKNKLCFTNNSPWIKFFHKWLPSSDSEGMWLVKKVKQIKIKITYFSKFSVNLWFVILCKKKIITVCSINLNILFHNGFKCDSQFCHFNHRVLNTIHILRGGENDICSVRSLRVQKNYFSSDPRVYYWSYSK